MKISATEVLAFSREKVFTIYRDRLPELARYLPDVRSIEVREREEPGPGRTRFVNEWKADREIPGLAKSFIKPEMLRWMDYALWDESDWSCTWRLELGFFKEHVKCQGRNFFREEDGGRRCRFELGGDLTIDLSGVAGIPRFLAPKVSPTVEKFVVALITPNLTQVSKAVEQLAALEG